MARRPATDLNVTDAELKRAFAGDWAAEFPPVLSIEQAATLAGVSVKTLYDWRHRGLLRECSCRRGRRVRLLRDRFVRFLFTPTET